jgi:hypothetical protein
LEETDLLKRVPDAIKRDRMAHESIDKVIQKNVLSGRHGPELLTITTAPGSIRK